jgi:serine/threonine protein kinase/hemoglobin-like flavoprotein
MATGIFSAAAFDFAVAWRCGKRSRGRAMRDAVRRVGKAAASAGPVRKAGAASAIKVMISYSHDDRPFVDALAGALQRRGVEIWYDQQLHLSDTIDTEIEERIREATAVLVIWSSSSRASMYVHGEAQRAFNLKKVIHATIDDEFPSVPFNAQLFVKLADWDFLSPAASYAPEIDRIVSSIRPLVDSRQTHNDTVARTKNRTNPELVSLFLSAKAKITNVKKIAEGEIADVYRGQYGRRQLAIKVVPDAMFSPQIRRAFYEEISLASNVNHPSFLRIFDVLFSEGGCLIVSDHLDGAQTIAKRLNNDTAFSLRDVIEILNQLCQATVEAQVIGLHYLAITPSQVFVRDDRTQILAQSQAANHVTQPEEVTVRKVVWLAPISFVNFAVNHGLRKELWHDESGPFAAPEVWLGEAWFKQCMGPILGREVATAELERAKLDRQHQFALGMLGWTMLAGCIPFRPRSTGRSARKGRRDRFLRDSKEFAKRVIAERWAMQAKALAHIVQRMVCHNPAERWPSMNQARLLIEALAGDYSADQLDDLVKAAYEKVRGENHFFYQEFYRRLFARAKHLKTMFPADMSRQHRMLDYAVGQLLNFNQLQSDPTPLTQFVDRHRRLGLSQRDFEIFGNVLMETFAAALAGEAEHDRMLAALEIVIWPGIDYMTSRCAAKRGPTTKRGRQSQRRRSLGKSGKRPVQLSL